MKGICTSLGSVSFIFYLLLLCHLMASPASVDTCKGILDWILFYPEILSSQLSFFEFWLKQFLLNLQWIEIFKLDNFICEGKASFLDVKKIKLKLPANLLKDNCKTTFSKWSLIPCLTFFCLKNVSLGNKAKEISSKDHTPEKSFHKKKDIWNILIV